MKIDYTTDQYGDRKDEINSLIMEEASERADERLQEIYDQPFEYFVEDADPDDPDEGTVFKEEFQDEFDELYDEEYEKLARELKFDYWAEDGILKG